MESSTSAANGSRDQLGHQGRRHKEKACSVTIQELSQLLNSKQRKWSNGSRPRRQIHKVPLLLRLKGQSSKRVYEPVVVSLGPYHHGRPDLRQAEELKYLCLDRCVSSSEEKKVLFFNKILQMIDEIRGCYAEVSIVEKYDDKTMALMMLLDACFILNFMENNSFTEKKNFQEWHNCLGVAATTRFVARDIMVLENQIPFQVLNLLIRLQYDKKEAEELYWRFLDWMMSLELERSETFVDDEEPPLHILEICRRVIVNQLNTDLNHQRSISSKFWWPRFIMRRIYYEDKSMSNLTSSYHTCRSVTDLKAKGIYITPSSSRSLRDIKFNSCAFNGQLHLPVRYVSEQTRVILSNMIAYEISPDSNTDLAVFSYTNFMKSLIESPADVKELQENGVFLNRFANHEQAVKVFKDINTFGLVNLDMFSDVKRRVEEHCGNMFTC